MLSATLVIMAFLGAEPAFESERIFEPEEWHNHGSSTVQTAEGDLITCWFHGSGERKADDVEVRGARKRAGATAWSVPFVMADTPDLPDCNPVLFIDPQQRLWLFWIAVQSNEWGSSLLKYRNSTSYQADGPPAWDWQDVIHARPTNLETMFLATLDAAVEKYAALLTAMPDIQAGLEAARAKAQDKLARRLGWMTRLHPIMTSDNRMMLGLYSDVFNTSLAAFTEDWGKTWTFSEPILTPELGNIQPAFVMRDNGDIVAFMRDNGMPKRIRKAVSQDSGLTWGPVEPMEIPNPGSSVDCIRLENGHWVLICNDLGDGRHVLSAYLSEDEGETWPWSRRIEDMPAETGSASYPSVIQAQDGDIHCTYSFTSADFKGSCIKHAWFNEEWIRGGAQ